MFCPQASLDFAGTKKAYDFYLDSDGKFDPVNVIAGKTITAGRTNYVLYPYSMNQSKWQELIFSRFENNEFLFSDSLWELNHSKIDIAGWNVARVDMSLKYLRSSFLETYVQNNNNIWNNWGKCNTARVDLLNKF